jgi:hypothetical protein
MTLSRQFRRAGLKAIFIVAAALCGLSSSALGQSAPSFYDRATNTIREIYDDPVQCAPGEYVQHKWVEWSKCVAKGAERLSRLFEYSPGFVKIVDDYNNRVQVIGQMIEDRILTRDNALREIAAERERLMKSLSPLLQDRVYREAAGQK